MRRTADMKKRKCPRCGKTYSEYPALSRRDNRTEICPDCGVIEAMESYLYNAIFSPAEETEEEE